MTDAATLEFEEADGVAVLRLDTARPSRDPVMKAYLRGAGGRVVDERSISIPTAANGLHSRYQELTAILARLGIRLEASGAEDDAVTRVQGNEAAFSAFSSLAASIWNGEVDTAAFRAFADVVAERLPARRLYPRQLLAAFHLAFAQNAANFSVPGAGKTAIVLAAYAYLNALPPEDPKHVDHLLVVGPLSAFKAWEDEFEAVFGRRAIAKRIAGFTPQSDREVYLRGISYAEREVEMTLTTYATLASTATDFQRFLGLPGRRAMVVLDEAHNIKRNDGVWANAALELAPHAGARVVLTGTPAPNGYEDLLNLFRFIYPHRDVVGFSASALRAMTDGAMASAIPRLKQQLRPFFTRIRKKDLGLSPAHETREPVGLSPLHEAIYTGVERAIMPQIRSGSGASSSLVRARLMRLRQAAVNPSLLLRPLEEEGLFDVEGGDFSLGEMEVADMVARFDAERDLVRLEMLAALARRVVAEQGKLLIWSYFLGNLTLLKRILSDSAAYVEIVTGATPVLTAWDDFEDGEATTREGIIDRFHRPGESAILIANPQAVGESISLHKAARTAIYFDRDFNAGRFIQSKDRIHRYSPVPLGDVQYHFMIGEGTIDETIDRRLIQKEERLADLVDTDDIPLFGLVEDGADADLRAVLLDYERRKTR
ncbi:DEAD/DEAH box helicase [Brevundimonas sp. PAMC22021]|uniref:DEAD/DEAH box helicase n=1 Tax=Brevundimonas sp. PAMC22021 TaxID=2861285 RepID=UPI001C6308CC|nr:DEAD/DEAH box helicase [Brevundimonas sp. PAMC22021]QYF86205.1 DEAD/DEAH box helicase [Brevundimonas sp. PAMC22021]